MSMTFERNGKKYRVGRLPAMKQFHILRRLVGVMGGLTGLASAQGAGKLDPFAALEPLAEGLASMPDEDAEYVINGCLAVVELEQSAGGWSKVVQKGVLMFEDLDMPTMLFLAWKVLQHNLSDFFGDLPQGLGDLIPTSTRSG